MGTRTVRLDQEAENTLERLRRITGLICFDLSTIGTKFS